MHPAFVTIALLIASNTFMTIAWYGHLKYADKALWMRILVSWLIALPEYALQVPANAIGVKMFSPTVLKIFQEVISLSVFVVFAWWYFGEAPTWRTLLAFVLISIAVGLIVSGRPAPPPTTHAHQDVTAVCDVLGGDPASDACPEGTAPRPPTKDPSVGV